MSLGRLALKVAKRILNKKNGAATARFLQEHTITIGGAMVLIRFKDRIYQDGDEYNTNGIGTCIGALYVADDGTEFVSDGTNISLVS